MCRSISRRSVYNMEGNTNLDFVREGNEIADLMTQCVYLCFALGIMYVIEQPLNSLFFRWRSLREATTTTTATP